MAHRAVIGKRRQQSGTVRARYAHDDDKEECRQHGLENEDFAEAGLKHRQFTITVRSERRTRVADEGEHAARRQRTDDLRDNVRHGLDCFETAARDQPERYGRIEMTA